MGKLQEQTLDVLLQGNLKVSKPDLPPYSPSVTLYGRLKWLTAILANL